MRKNVVARFGMETDALEGMESSWADGSHAPPLQGLRPLGNGRPPHPQSVAAALDRSEFLKPDEIRAGLELAVSLGSPELALMATAIRWASLKGKPVLLEWRQRDPGGLSRALAAGRRRADDPAAFEDALARSAWLGAGPGAWDEIEDMLSAGDGTRGPAWERARAERAILSSAGLGRGLPERTPFPFCWIEGASWHAKALEFSGSDAARQWEGPRIHPSAGVVVDAMARFPSLEEILRGARAEPALIARASKPAQASVREDGADNHVFIPVRWTDSAHAMRQA
jgi:hypothetical protein